MSRVVARTPLFPTEARKPEKFPDLCQFRGVDVLRLRKKQWSL